MSYKKYVLDIKCALQDSVQSYNKSQQDALFLNFILVHVMLAWQIPIALNTVLTTPDDFLFILFSVYLIHRGYDPSDMELVNTEIRLQISYMK